MKKIFLFVIFALGAITTEPFPSTRDSVEQNEKYTKKALLSYIAAERKNCSQQIKERKGDYPLQKDSSLFLFQRCINHNPFFTESDVSHCLTQSLNFLPEDHPVRKDIETSVAQEIDEIKKAL